MGTRSFFYFLCQLKPTDGAVTCFVFINSNFTFTYTVLSFLFFLTDQLTLSQPVGAGGGGHIIPTQYYVPSQIFRPCDGPDMYSIYLRAMEFTRCHLHIIAGQVLAMFS